MKLITFLIGLVLGGLLLIVPLNQSPPDGLESLRSLAVQLDGRKKPLDTVAQETVAKIHGSTTYRSAEGDRADALSTYLTMWFNTRNWNEEPFVLVSYRPLNEVAGLALERKQFTFQELMANRDLAAIVSAAHRKDLNDEDLSRNEREALTIESRLNLLYQSVGDR
ncbi:MAG: cytochrome C biogenesis protein, partial [Cyanobacteria bacterium P01_E01_bin.43]